MPQPYIEHVNLTVSDPERMAGLLDQLFDWHVRWQGPARDGGRVIHVGDERTYLAVYTPAISLDPDVFAKGRPLNHVGILVDDLDDIERRVVAAGLEPFNHADYDPGRRFYFLDYDGTEFEIVSYA
ncbi:VOC family protein [Sphingomonas sp. LM7]|uniref:VOC family protein n=1 Tax=Sphingomonas sp. LM7 TaxID=1938607 RepID=UPI000983F663|nr:VOC family protein [Sphingomonas sp. LM7]AQR72602.1 glyoxalase [Sphingomonas sp. LM7]